MPPKSETHQNFCIKLGLKIAACAAAFSLVIVLLWVTGWIQPSHVSSAITANFYRFEPGVSIAQQIEYQSEGGTDLRAVVEGGKKKNKGKTTPPGLVQKFSSRVRAERSTTILEWRDSSWIAVVRLENPEVSYFVDGHKDAAQSGALRRELSDDMFVRISPEGQILSVRFPANTGVLAKSFIQTLFGITQFVFPQKNVPADGRWEMEEDDPGGRSVVLYERLPSDKSAISPETSGEETPRFRKTRLRYLSPNRKKVPGELSTEQTTVTKGSLNVLFSLRTGNLLSVDGTEEQEFIIGDKRVGHARNTIKLKFLRQISVSSPELTELRKRYADLEGVSKDISLSANVAREAGRLAIEQNVLGETTPAEILEELKAADLQHATFDQTLYRKLLAMFRLSPDSCATFGKELAKSDAKSRTFQYIAGALAAAGHEKAQEALIGVLRARKGDVPAMTGLISVLTNITEPEPTLIELLNDIAFNERGDDPIVGAALFALGVSARNLEPVHPERAAQVADALIAKLMESSSDLKSGYLLSALGNSASSRAVPAILKRLSDSLPPIRAAAVSSLRLMDTPEVEPALLRALATDSEESVRQQAASTLAFRQMTVSSFNALKVAVRKDGSANVRLSALRTLAEVIDRYPGVRSVIRQVAANDPLEDLRELASDILRNNLEKATGRKLHNQKHDQ